MRTKGAVLALACLVCTVAPGTALAQQITQVSLKTNDLVYDAGSNKIWASIPASATLYPNTILPIDPATGALGTPIPMAGNPNQLAVSADGSTLYVGLDALSAVARVDLATLTPGPQFPVTLSFTCSAGSVPVARDIAVQPGHPDVVAIAQVCSGYSGFAQVAVYDATSGAARPAITAPGYDGRLLQFGASGSIVYAYDPTTSSYPLSRVRVDADGATLLDSQRYLLLGGNNFSVAGGKLYGARGEVVEPDSYALLGTCPPMDSTRWGRLMAFDGGRNRIVILFDDRVVGYDAGTFLSAWSFPLSADAYTASAMTTTSVNRVAFRTPDIVYLIEYGALEATTFRQLRIDKAGTGMGTVTSSAGSLNCGESCTAAISQGASVTLTATASSGSTFSGWSGDCDAAGTVTMTASRACTANFSSTGAVPVRRIALRALDLMYDSNTQLLYASLAGNNGPLGNSIVSIDPATGAVGSPTWVGSEPSHLARTDDGQHLYVALNGSLAVARLDWPALTRNLFFPIPTNGYYARSIPALRAQPGNADTVAVGYHYDIGIFDLGVKRGPSVTSYSIDRDSFVFNSSGDRIYHQTYRDFWNISVTATGPEAGTKVTNLFTSERRRLAFDGGRVYADSGDVVDPAVPALVATLPGPSKYAVTVDAGSPVFLQSSFASTSSTVASIGKYDATTFRPVWSADFALSEYVSSPGSLTPVGGNSAAFLNGSAIYIVDYSAAVNTRVLYVQSSLSSAWGTVTLNGGACGDECSKAFPPGTVVTMVATPGSNSAFTGWTGDPDCEDGVVTMDGGHACTANFASLPYSPGLLVPSGTIELGTRPTYSWYSSYGAIQYEVLVEDSTGATKVDLVYTPTEAGCSSGSGRCTVTPDVALAAGAAKWKVRAANAVGWGAWSSQASFSVYAAAVPPAKVTIVSPTGVYGGQSATFSWNPVPGATWYYVRIDDAATPGKVMAWYEASDIGCGMGTGTCSIYVSALAVGNGEWKVLAWNDYGYGPVSDPIAYTIVVTPPAAPTLVSPKGTIATATPTYVWQAVPAAREYYLRVANMDANPGYYILTTYTATAAGCPDGTGTCSATPTTALPAGQKRWWLSAYNANGSGPNSDTGYFNVNLNPLPGPAVLVSPTGTVTTTTPTYTWNAATGATWYFLRVVDATGTAKIGTWYTAAQAGCETGSTCAITPSVPLAIGAATWKVKPWNDGGDGPISDEMAFAVAPAVTPTLVSPTGAVATATPTYSWTAVPGASWYYLWVDDSGGTGKVSTWYRAADVGCASGTGTCAVTPAVALASGAASWKVQTWGAWGYGPWSGTTNITVSVQSSSPGKPTLVSPTGSIGTATPTYTWNAVSGATWYYLWVSDSSGAAKVGIWYTADQVGCAAGTGTCSVTPVTQLALGAASWKVKAWNEAGDGPVSEPMAFTVSVVYASTPVAPAGTTATRMPTYRWRALPGTTWYYLWVDDSSGEGKIQIWYRASEVGCSEGTGECSVTPSTQLAPGVASWQVQTWGAWGYGPWSSAMSFVVQ